SLNQISPASALSARVTNLLKVVFPQPLSPTRPRHSPRRTSRLTLSRAVVSLASLAAKKPRSWTRNFLHRPFTERSGPAASAPSGHGSLAASKLPVLGVISRTG